MSRQRPKTFHRTPDDNHTSPHVRLVRGPYPLEESEGPLRHRLGLDLTRKCSVNEEYLDEVLVTTRVSSLRYLVVRPRPRKRVSSVSYVTPGGRFPGKWWLNRTEGWKGDQDVVGSRGRGPPDRRQTVSVPTRRGLDGHTRGGTVRVNRRGSCR